jgi:hypothetical protein
MEVPQHSTMTSGSLMIEVQVLQLVKAHAYLTDILITRDVTVGYGI